MKIYRKQRDSRFIIYQSLYIFAIAVLIFKGTDLSLDEVSPSNRNIVKLNPGEIVVDTMNNKVISWDKSKDSIVQIAVKEDTVVKKKDVGKVLIIQVGKEGNKNGNEGTSNPDPPKTPDGDISKPGSEGTVPGDGK